MDKTNLNPIPAESIGISSRDGEIATGAIMWLPEFIKLFSGGRRIRKRGAPPPTPYFGGLFYAFPGCGPFALQRQRNRLAELLLARCPDKPWNCDHFDMNKPRPLLSAIEKRYLQVNPPRLYSFIVIDIDRTGASDAWQDAMLPPPTWCSINPKNGHAHLVLALKNPVWAGGENQRAARFFEALEDAYRERLGGDVGYAGLLTKNPLHQSWMLHCPAGVRLYDLTYLSEFVELSKHRRRVRETPQEGWRNCGVFDELRTWAYSVVREHANFDAFLTDCIARAGRINSALSSPMYQTEVLHISRSVAKWVWRKMGEGRGTAAFKEKQSARGRKGGRPRTTCPEGKPKPWEVVGISRATWYRERSRSS